MREKKGKMHRPTKSQREKQNSLPEDINNPELKSLPAGSFRWNQRCDDNEMSGFCSDLK